MAFEKLVWLLTSDDSGPRPLLVAEVLAQLERAGQALGGGRLQAEGKGRREGRHGEVIVEAPAEPKHLRERRAIEINSLLFRRF